MIRTLFYRLPQNVARIFSWKNVPWHILAIALTALIVITGIDWWYYLSTRNLLLFTIVFPAVLLGGIVPIIAPLTLLIWGKIRKSLTLTTIGYTLGQAAILGSALSSFYKAFTGRVHPELFSTAIDISRQFRIGFWRGGIFWGWPSSHTTIAFAMAVAFIMFFPKKRYVRILMFLYAFYIGFGISVTIHWFSEYVAGAIFGTIIGTVVGKSYAKRLSENV